MGQNINLRVGRIIAGGKLLFGETRWQSPLARLVGLSPALIQQIADGSRSLTDAVYRQVATAFIVEAARLRKNADKVDEIANKILRELDDGKTKT
jgi:hypothetical protein